MILNWYHQQVFHISAAVATSRGGGYNEETSRCEMIESGCNSALQWTSSSTDCFTRLTPSFNNSKQSYAWQDRPRLSVRIISVSSDHFYVWLHTEHWHSSRCTVQNLIMCVVLLHCFCTQVTRKCRAGKYRGIFKNIENIAKKSEFFYIFDIYQAFTHTLLKYKIYYQIVVCVCVSFAY